MNLEDGALVSEGKKLGNKNQKMFIGHHLNNSCSESNFKNASVLMTHFNMTEIKTFTLLANMWSVKKKVETFSSSWCW